ncbi:hypothetical protein M9H77_30894 [Catharanthus roseus]|uniref:Uncharacterized protein n=1 Tax=Catharanthus roseus TaxID=4058 RepID=A0ACB9ZZU6_CATRO|nr:hypothetical protein M9H77_30894 [Catharanthus roseus]
MTSQQSQSVGLEGPNLKPSLQDKLSIAGKLRWPWGRELASKQTANQWVFEPEYPGKSRIFNGRLRNPSEQPVLIGKPYIVKLIHQVDDKIHGLSSGHYALVTQQPLRGRAKQGGQRVGETEVWALEGFGVAHIL